MDRQRGKRRSEDRIAGSASGRRGSLRDALRKAALAVGVIGVAYFVARRFGAGDADQSSHGEETGIDDRGESGGVTIEVDGDDGDDGEGEGENDVNAGEDDDTDLPGEDRSPAEIQERAEESAHEEPAEPGEMTVDEDVVEDVIEGEENEESEG